MISEADFIAIRNIRVPRGNPDTDHCYLAAGLLRCGICRRAESCWATTEPPTAAATVTPAHPDLPKNFHIGEDRILAT